MTNFLPLAEYIADQPQWAIHTIQSIFYKLRIEKLSISFQPLR